MEKNRIGIIGCGNMGGVLVRSLLEAGYRPSSVYVSDTDKSKLRTFKDTGVQIHGNLELSQKSDIIIIAVKPAAVKEVVSGIRDALAPSKILISIAAGVSTGAIEACLDGRKVPVVRVMPNVNARVNAGLLPYCLGSHARGCEAIVENLLKPMGMVFRLPEKRFDSVTAVSGSGPGFLFYIAEALEQICREKNFTSGQSKAIVSYLLYGTGRMLVETGLPPRKLKDMVTSPGGTTEAGLGVLEKKRFREIMGQVVERAENRSRELSLDKGCEQLLRGKAKRKKDAGHLPGSLRNKRDN